MNLHTYLNYGGNCEQAFRFYEQHLGAKITSIMTHGQNPAPNPLPPELKDTILHARLEIGGTVLMGSDVPPDRFQPMRSVYLTLTVGSTEEAERIYDGGDLLRLPLRDAPGQVRHVLDDPPRAPDAVRAGRRPTKYCLPHERQGLTSRAAPLRARIIWIRLIS